MKTQAEHDKDGGPAFPFKCQGPTTAPEFYYGMSLRDWFAGQALSNPDLSLTMDSSTATEAQRTAMRCYRYADAMLAERIRQ